MQSGTIKRIMDKGYGFISVNGGQDVFFHISGLGEGVDFNSLREGQTVSFDLEQGEKGMKAVNVVAA